MITIMIYHIDDILPTKYFIQTKAYNKLKNCFERYAIGKNASKHNGILEELGILPEFFKKHEFTTGKEDK